MTFLRSSLHLQLLHFHPHHPLSCKEGTIYSQALRYNMIISEYNIFQEELNNLTSILLAHAHPHHLIIKNIQKVLIYTHSNLLSQRTPHIEKKTFFPSLLPFQTKINHSEPLYIRIGTQLTMAPHLPLSGHLNLYLSTQNLAAFTTIVPTPHKHMAYHNTIPNKLFTYTYIHPNT